MSVGRGAYYRHGKRWSPIYRCREAAGLTLVEAAAAIGVSERTLRTWEKPEAGKPCSDAIVAALRPHVPAWRAATFAAIAAKPEAER
jgi:hypothetical protein